MIGFLMFLGVSLFLLLSLSIGGTWSESRKIRVLLTELVEEKRRLRGPVKVKDQ